MAKKKSRKGDRIAHYNIDDPKGLARTGVVEDIVYDDQGGSLVIARWDDCPDKKEAFDEREIVFLHQGIGEGSPVIVQFRHLKNLFKRPIAVLFLLFTLLASFTLAYVSAVEGWSERSTLILGLLLILVVMIASEIFRKKWNI